MNGGRVATLWVFFTSIMLSRVGSELFQGFPILLILLAIVVMLILLLQHTDSGAMVRTEL
jgi:hypothetical protein